MLICGIVGWKNSGKTYFAQKLINYFNSKNFKVASIKHAHHEFDIDKPGTDSYLHRKAGSQEILLGSKTHSYRGRHYFDVSGHAINFSFSSVNATTEGVVRPPSLLVMTVGVPPSITATQELVVPKSIPIIFDIYYLLQ